MNTYWNGAVICPYYKRATDKKLTCEWKGEDEITQAFKHERDKDAYMYEYCSQDKYKLCSLCVVNDRYHDSTT